MLTRKSNNASDGDVTASPYRVAPHVPSSRFECAFSPHVFLCVSRGADWKLCVCPQMPTTRKNEAKVDRVRAGLVLVPFVGVIRYFVLLSASRRRGHGASGAPRCFRLSGFRLADRLAVFSMGLPSIPLKNPKRFHTDDDVNMLTTHYISAEGAAEGPDKSLMESQVPESLESADSKKSRESAESSESVDTPGSAESEESVDTPGSAESSESVDTPGSAESEESVDTPGSAESSESVDTPGSAESEESVDTPGSAESSESVDTPGSAEFSEYEDTPESAESAESVASRESAAKSAESAQSSKSADSAETSDSPDSPESPESLDLPDSVSESESSSETDKDKKKTSAESESDTAGAGIDDEGDGSDPVATLEEGGEAGPEVLDEDDARAREGSQMAGMDLSEQSDLMEGEEMRAQDEISPKDDRRSDGGVSMEEVELGRDGVKEEVATEEEQKNFEARDKSSQIFQSTEATLVDKPKVTPSHLGG
ncbi:uncharacterized protein LOC144006979 isoform X3 [Festucalex cinctus]